MVTANGPDERIAQLLGALDTDPVVRLQLELFKLINDRRQQSGLQPLALDARLSAAALDHSTDMAEHRFCSHTGKDGTSVRARIARYGYPYNNWAGENILCSQKTPAAALRWWMNSRPHRKNLLHAHFIHIGIGIDPDGQFGPIWTLTFAAGADETVLPDFLQSDVIMASGDQAAPAPADDGDQHHRHKDHSNSVGPAAALTVAGGPELPVEKDPGAPGP